MQTFFKVFILMHAAFGFLSLLAGTISVIAKKGGKWHKKSGLVFYYGMLVAAGSGLVASLLPGHYNAFLFVVALFTLYLTLTGYRALGFAKVRERSQLKPDIFYAYFMLSTAIVMIISGIILIVRARIMGWVLIVFGIIGAANAYTDLKAFKDLKNLRNKALRLHIGKISGAYIAAFTAFFVTNSVLPSILSWLLPTVFGVVFITYWVRKTKPKERAKRQILE